MDIAVLGLGYVGVVTSVCLARNGHTVAGVDPNKTKVDMVNRGTTPIVEPGLEALLSSAVAAKKLTATTKHVDAIRGAELILVCVGTPGNSNGSLDLTYVKRVCEEIGHELREADGFKVVAMRSTMLPGSMEEVVIPALETASGLRVGEGFGLCINPEFLREGTAIYDYDNPPKTVIGADDSRSAKVMSSIYSELDAPLIITSLKSAEMVKYADNTWHAVKVTFANEIGRLSQALGVDSRELMQIFCQDTKLNISTAYLRPGFAFGGSCLPKDLRALTYKGRQLDVEVPMLSSVLDSNQKQIQQAFEMINSSGSTKVGMLGLSFKEGTDDLRESPVVALAESLIGKGFELSIYDRNVSLASLLGANRDYIMNRIPHIGKLLVERPEDVIRDSDVIVLATGEKDFGEIARSVEDRKQIIDLVGIWGLPGDSQNYRGIGW